MDMIAKTQDSGPAAGAPPSPDMAAAGGALSAPMGGETAPMGAPMSTPEPKMGNREGALVNLGIALDLIESAIPNLGSETEEGQKAMAAMRSLGGLLGPRKKKTNELQDAEIMQMLQNLPRAGGMSPEARAMASAPMVPGMQPPGPAPAPGPAPGPGAAPAAPPMM
jgi:hypothetical protein